MSYKDNHVKGCDSSATCDCYATKPLRDRITALESSLAEKEAEHQNHLERWQEINKDYSDKIEELKRALAAKDTRIAELDARLNSETAKHWRDRALKSEGEVAALQAERKSLYSWIRGTFKPLVIRPGGATDVQVTAGRILRRMRSQDPAEELKRRLDEARREANQKVVDYLRLCWRCTCHEAYKDRGMTAPDCFRCDLEPELLGIEAEARKSEGDPA